MRPQALATSLDYRQTLRQVASLAVPTHADWCSVQMVDDGVLRTLAVAHVDPEKVQLAKELETRWPPDPDAPGGAAQVARTGESLLVEDVTDEMLVAAAQDEEHLRVARELGLQSAMSVPLIAKDRVLGVLTFVAAESGRRYTRRRRRLRRRPRPTGRPRHRQRRPLLPDPPCGVGAPGDAAAAGPSRARRLAARHRLPTGGTHRRRRGLLRRQRPRRRPGHRRPRRRHGPRGGRRRLRFADALGRPGALDPGPGARGAGPCHGPPHGRGTPDPDGLRRLRALRPVAGTTSPSSSPGTLRRCSSRTGGRGSSTEDGSPSPRPR